jgi:hypothetical protein
MPKAFGKTYSTRGTRNRNTKLVTSHRKTAAWPLGIVENFTAWKTVRFAVRHPGKSHETSQEVPDKHSDIDITDIKVAQSEYNDNQQRRLCLATTELLPRSGKIRSMHVLAAG